MKKFSLLILVLGLLSLTSCKNDNDIDNLRGKQNTVIVEEILELRYRDAIIRLSSGELVIVNQACLKPGDKIIITSRYYCCGLGKPACIGYTQIPEVSK